MIEGARFRRKIEHVLCNAFGLGLVSLSSCVVSTSFSSDTFPSSFGLASEIEQNSVKPLLKGHVWYREKVVLKDITS